MKRIAIYNQNCTLAGTRDWETESEHDDENPDVTWYDESDLVWAKPWSERVPMDSNEMHVKRVAREIVQELANA